LLFPLSINWLKLLLYSSLLILVFGMYYCYMLILLAVVYIGDAGTLVLTALILSGYFLSELPLYLSLERPF
jgi:hypothetical protein